MNQGKMVFAHLMEFASDDIFKHCVRRYNGNYKAKDFTCWKQFLCMIFGQLTHRESLSDTALCLKFHKSKLYHLGIGKPFHKSTIVRANERRDWRIFRDFALNSSNRLRCCMSMITNWMSNLKEEYLHLILQLSIYALMFFGGRHSAKLKLQLNYIPFSI